MIPVLLTSLNKGMEVKENQIQSLWLLSLATTVSSLPFSGDYREVLPVPGLGRGLCGKDTTAPPSAFYRERHRKVQWALYGALGGREEQFTSPPLRNYPHTPLPGNRLSPFPCTPRAFPGSEPFPWVCDCLFILNSLGAQAGPLTSSSPVVR